MGHSRALGVLLFAGCGVLACTTNVDVPTRSGAEGGSLVSQGGVASTSGAGASNDAGGASNDAGGASNALGGATSFGGAAENSVGGTTVVPLGTAGAAEISASSAAGNAAVDTLRSMLPAITTPDITDAEYATFIADSNAFGLELHRRLIEGQGLARQNVAFSPVSAQLALAMTYGAASGETAIGMKVALHDQLGGAKYHAGCNRLTRELASRNYSKTDTQGVTRRVEIALANSLWTEATLPINAPYLDLLGQQYDSGLWRADFVHQSNRARLAINDWVTGQTRGKIMELLGEPDVTSDTAFVIVNALYFYGNWQTVFDKLLTKPGPFHTLAGNDVEVDMMHASSTYAYKTSEAGDVLQMPYVSSNLRMTLVLPAAGQFEAVRAQLSQTWLSSMTDGLAREYVVLTLPKFDIVTPQLILEDGLGAMGMAEAFTNRADFGVMTSVKGVCISKVVQKAFIGVNESGTEAAAATSVSGTWSSVPPTPIEVSFDRPFFFFIQDKTGIVLFSGQVVDPTL